MKLNYDCVRDVLFALEELIHFENYLELKPINVNDIRICNENMKKYQTNDVVYALMKLTEAGYIMTEIQGKTYFVYDITFSGHEFLKKLRESM